MNKLPLVVRVLHKLTVSNLKLRSLDITMKLHDEETLALVHVVLIKKSVLVQADKGVMFEKKLKQFSSPKTGCLSCLDTLLLKNHQLCDIFLSFLWFFSQIINI